jgi:hypothetical protein
MHRWAISAPSHLPHAGKLAFDLHSVTRIRSLLPKIGFVRVGAVASALLPALPLYRLRRTSHSYPFVASQLLSLYQFFCCLQLGILPRAL